MALRTQWGEESLIPASSGNFLAPYRALAVAGMDGLVAPDWERPDEMGGWEQVGGGERWTERQRHMVRGTEWGGGSERERNRERGTSGGREQKGKEIE